MTRKMYFGGVAVVCATIVVSAGLVAQEKGYEERSPEQQQMMAAWMEYMTPGEHHELLAKRVGEWNYVGKIWEAPGMEPMEFAGTAKVKMVMGGRYLLEKIEGPFMGDTFHGLGIFGYDNLTKQYVGTWIDSLGTGIMRYEGNSSGDGTIHWKGEQPDFINGNYKPIRSVDTIKDENNLKSVSYSTTPDGEEFKHMELRYTRAE